ncbi:MAG: hypothetical protein LUC33_07300, partial [Prevotellaceae bacterium]|nr:hypothetical protein [Prevotellaceae bacterium]
MSTEYISGGLETTGSAVVGGSLTVAGGTTLNGRVTVKGFLEAPNIKTPCKGLFASEKELLAQFPNPMSGWWALVGSSSPLSLYRASGGAWECIGTDTFTIEIENSSVVSAVEELQDKLATETSDRKAQDTTLQASIDTKQAALKHYAESSSALSGQTFISGSSSSSPETNGVYSVQAYGAAAHVADGTQVTRGRLVTFGFSIGLDLGEYTLSGYGKDMTMDATTADGSIHLQSPNGVITVAREIQMIAPKTTLTDGTEYNGAVRVYTNTTAQNEGFTHNGSKVLSVRDIEDDLLGEGREVSDGVSISAHSQALSAYQGLQLSNSISSEASTRASAVSSLQSSVSANTSDISSLQSSVSSLESSVKSKQDGLSYYHEGTNTGQLGGMTASPDPVYLKWSYDSDTGQQIAIHT